MAVWGADADELDRLASQLDGYARVLEGHRATINSRLHSAPWEGPEADRFRHDWDTRYVRSLLSAASALTAARATLISNAHQQRAASNASGLARGVATPTTAAVIADPSLVARLDAALDEAGPTMQALWGMFGAGISVISGGELALFVARNWSVLRHVNDSTLRRVVWKELAGKDVGALARRAHVGPLAAIGAAYEAASMGGDFASGNYSKGMWEGARLLLDGVGLLAPKANPYLAAGEVGVGIGLYLDHQFHIGDHASDGVLGYVTGHGVTDLGHRYDGATGFLNFAHDMGGAAVEGAGSMASSAVKGAASLLNRIW